MEFQIRSTQIRVRLRPHFLRIRKIPQRLQCRQIIFRVQLRPAARQPVVGFRRPVEVGDEKRTDQEREQNDHAGYDIAFHQEDIIRRPG